MPSRPSCSQSLGSRGMGLRSATMTAQHPNAPMPTRNEVTQSGPISRIRTALKMNEQPQMAPSRIIQNQSRSDIANPLDRGRTLRLTRTKVEPILTMGDINSGDGESGGLPPINVYAATDLWHLHSRSPAC